MVHSNARGTWYRLSFKVLVCLLCFVCGCAVSLSFLSSLECKSSLSSSTMDINNQPLHAVGSVKDKSTFSLPLVILIFSAPENIQRRHTLRRTWLTLIDQNIKYFFVIGKKSMSEDFVKQVTFEQQHYSDLLILPEVEEGYDILATKVLRSFVWVYENLHFEHVLKVDDDSFVNPKSLLKELRGKLGDDLLYWGYFNGRAQIHHRGKWKDTEWNLCDRYLPYARGGGYILSRSAVQYLSNNAQVLKTFKNEDVSVGLWMAPLNIERLHDIRFDTEWTSRGCSNQYLVTHPHNETEMQRLYDTLSNFGKVCVQEYQKRIAYTYDWSALPSQCCSTNVS